MKSKIGGVSTVLFFVGLLLYCLAFMGNDRFLLGAVIVSAIGLILALIAGKSTYKIIGLFGNGIIIIITIVVPFLVTTFFWNHP
ncbi:hypothetical protein IMZ08_17685 [Bacillus luteolus]|uniref:Uncharacterized protein n=1 Tax=Litchfieldia luteola TaxID=682179 RepID=A0ABR9QMY5_9BACI|nr:hypothetical protein [Cytobacillus luteolus]MBE4909870.1 hypothetical protein [Cytobacillus luteolus]MBP1942580.1 hypothetical protein [Cytobacillus luteolus]